MTDTTCPLCGGTGHLQATSYGVRIAAEIAGVTPDALRKAIRRAALKASKPVGGSDYIIQAEDLATWIKSRP